MKRFFIDSNVILDFVLSRPDFAEAAEKLFDAADQQRVQLLVSSLTFVTTHYVASKKLGKLAATTVLADLFLQAAVVTIDASTVAQALQSNAPDFEDAVQLYAALAAGADAIVTRDPGGFRGSLVLVLDPLAALRQL